MPEISDALKFLRDLYPRGATLLLIGRVIQLLNSLGLSVVLVRRFGFATVGVFALGFIAVSVLGLLSTLGLNAYLPRVTSRHGQLSTVGLSLQLAMLPVWIAGCICYAWLQARSGSEFQIILLVALSGITIGFSNVGMMLSIMDDRFMPGVVAPLVETVGVLFGAIFSRTPAEYAVYLLTARALSAAVIWAGFRFEQVSFATISATLRNSLAYMAPDGVAMFSEQTATLILAALVPRAQLGLFRICQQILTASDTPGWSYVQAHYPQLVRGSRQGMEKLALTIARLGAGATVLCIVGSAVLAYVFYRAPVVVPMMLVLSITLTWRYRNNLYDQALRATGRVQASTYLAASKLLVSGILSFALIHTFGVWGAILSTAFVSVAAGIVYRRVYDRHLPIPALAL